MQKSKIISFLFLIGIFFVACQKDNLVISENPVDPPVVTMWETSISGIVTDRESNALEYAEVHIGDRTVQTNEHGRFTIKELVSSEKASIRISKAGYFDNYPVFYPERDQAQEVRIQLSERRLAGSINNGSSVVEYENHKIDFGTSKFTTEDGSIYSGSVNVYMDYLDPTDPNLSEFMPGDLVGVTTEGEEQILESYGMVNVELEDESGNALDLDGEAIIRMNVPSAIIGSAPASIPLWYFDEVSGNWIEDGMAVLEGNEYVGSVTHFTFWNCDVPFPLVTINGLINTSADATTLTVRITRENGNTGSVIPNARGYFEGKVPEGEILLLEIISPCGTVIHSEEIGAFSNDASVGPFTVDSDVLMVSVSGTAVDCDMNPLVNGYVLVNSGAGVGQYITVNDGVFSDIVIVCSENPIEIIVYDTNNLKASETIEFPYNTNLTTGEISSCFTDIPAQGMYISGSDVNYFIPAEGKVSIIGNQSSYEFTLLDDFGNGNKRIYQITILNWTQDINDLQLLLTYSTQVIGVPGDEYAVSFDNVVNAIIDEDSGGLLDIELEGCEVNVISSTTETSYSDHNVRIVGLFE